MFNLALIALAMLGDPAIALSPAGVCSGTVVAANVVVFDDCSLATLRDADVYVDASDEPLAQWSARAGRKPGRVVLTFSAVEVSR